MFVFETANRIVVEEPRFRHATYFYEIEEPLPVSCQVIRHLTSGPGLQM